MFNSVSAAVISATLTFGAAAATETSQPPQPISTQAAYQSWLAWYHVRPSAPADANGPRFRQLLSSADGNRYFLQGLDDTSPQVRELSKQGLIQTPTKRSRIEIINRRHSRDARIRQQADEIFVAVAAAEIYGADIATADYAIVSDAEPGNWPTGVWQLGSSGRWPNNQCAASFAEPLHDYSPRDIEPLPDERSLGWLDPDVVAIVSVWDRGSDWGRWGRARRPLRGIFSRRLQLLAQAERRQLSDASARELLDLLGQTARSSPADDVTVEQLKQSLGRQVRHPRVPADPNGSDAGSERQNSWPTYQMRIELERQEDVAQTVADQSSHQGPDVFGKRLVGPQRPQPADSIAGSPASDGTFNSSNYRPPATEQFVPSGLPVAWANCPLSGSQSLAPGTYKLLLTFQSWKHVPFGLEAAKLRSPTVGAIVFRVKSQTSEAIGPYAPSRQRDESPLAEPLAWEILYVAVSNSQRPADDACLPAPSTLASRTKPSPPIHAFFSPTAR